MRRPKTHLVGTAVTSGHVERLPHPPGRSAIRQEGRLPRRPSRFRPPHPIFLIPAEASNRRRELCVSNGKSVAAWPRFVERCKSATVPCAMSLAFAAAPAAWQYSPRSVAPQSGDNHRAAASALSSGRVLNAITAAGAALWIALTTASKTARL